MCSPREGSELWFILRGTKKSDGMEGVGNLGQAGIEGMCDDVRIGKNNTQYNTMC